ncbi:DUF429 domain-containing protein [Pararobbsia silviterrae]|uniref:DUF429 domain-containing protein n=1 Tax=Pararobbsia silviterrae TaxID=1792498 RepID=A0A494YB36_9BURK|nr:DUF429 domain-containing protein [Pararobbsia silviterrae]RKP58970.1 DUF429 domain-containing protein [Pararobbsia silviterrae]
MSVNQGKRSVVIAGIDVGGIEKGFHLVVMRGSSIVDVVTDRDPGELHRRCLQHEVEVVAIDAPSKWGVEGARREAEQALARERISCFPTPTLARAQSSTTTFFKWMLNGARLYEVFAQTHPVDAVPVYAGRRASIEVFPYAITCALLGRDVASAKLKRTQRRRLLEDLGIDTARLKSIDFLDAGLCAVAARCFVEGKTRAVGDVSGGYIVLPVGIRLIDQLLF